MKCWRITWNGEREDYNETLDAVTEAYEDVKAGRTQPAGEFLEELRVKYGLSGRNHPAGKTRRERNLEWLLSQHAGEAGLRWLRRLEEPVASLSNLPGRCKLAPENDSVPFEMRQLLYGHKPHVYRILFTIDDETVYALRIRHGHRKHLTSP